MVKEKMKKTKIVCTIGPASQDKEMLKKLIKAGMNVMRCNFSHGDYEEHGMKMDTLREVNKELGTDVAIMLDTKGPEIRTGAFEGGFTEFKKGQVSVITPEEIVGSSDRFTISYKELYKDVKPGAYILVNDGQVALLVDHVEGQDIYCVAANDGRVKNTRGINVPGTKLQFEFLSEKDKNDLIFGCKQDVNFIAASFVRRKQDVLDIKKLIAENGKPDIKVLPKIECVEGVENIDEIIEVADGIMVARGDLGVEVPAEEVPLIQKSIIRKCNAAGKVVITATQMLESMQENPRPTRAEVSDVANAIYDGTSATMLSGETAAGAYPVEAVKMMARIAERTEKEINYRKRFNDMAKYTDPGITDAICHATCSTAYDLDAKAIITVTKSGFSARMISKYRPGCDIIGCAMDEKVCRQLNLSWGVRPILLGEEWEVFVLFERAINACKRDGLLEKGDVTVITSGVPIGRSGTTNMLKVQVVDD